MARLRDLIMTDYRSQSNMRESSTSRSNVGAHIIIGCGGVGFWLAIILATLNAPRCMPTIYLFDGDKLEDKNRNRLLYPRSAVGRNKALLLAEFILNIRPEIGDRIVAIPLHYPSPDDVRVSRFANSYRWTVVWDCTDNLGFQRLLSKNCAEYNKTRRSTKICYRKIGYDGDQVSVYGKDYMPWSTGTADTYSTTANVVSSIQAAMLGLASIEKIKNWNNFEELSVNVGNLFFKKSGKNQGGAE